MRLAKNKRYSLLIQNMSGKAKRFKLSTAVQKVTKLGVSYVIRPNKRVSPGNFLTLFV
jgi:hypothetical protein